MDSGDGEVVVAQGLRWQLADGVVSECSAEVGEWNALCKRAGYCRSGCSGLLERLGMELWWLETLRGGAGWIRGGRSSTETFTKCNSTAGHWSLVDVLQLTTVILR
jgi:hypothetical protein